MKKLYRDRLLKLAKHLESGVLGHEKFDFGVIHETSTDQSPNKYGTLGCAMGECPVVFKRQWKFDLQGEPILRRSIPDVWNTAFRSSLIFFGLTDCEGEHLFVPTRQFTYNFGGRWLGPKATRKQVAANIRAFVKKMA